MPGCEAVFVAQDHRDRDDYRAAIRHVVGRSSNGVGRGLPAVAEIGLENPDGTVVAGTSLPVGPTVRRDRATAICEIHPLRFLVCPICLGEGPLTKEHLPPKRFGGQVMTYTCKRCNSTFGSRTEEAMLDWFDRAIRVVYRSEGNPRPVASGRVIYLRNEAGEVILMNQATGPAPDALSQLMRSGKQVVMDVRDHASAQRLNGMLKSAYLAAALHLGGVPDLPSVREIRQELLDVVQARSRKHVVAGPHAQRLRSFRTGASASGPPLALMKIEADDPRYVISLAGTILVDWPFPEVDPERSRAAQVVLA